MLTLLQDSAPFPPVERALHKPNGLLAMGGDLAPARLLDAYRHGIFPWFNKDDPILWWSPDPRMVLFPQEFKVSRSLRKTLARKDYEVRADSAFEQVMRACAAPRPGQNGTWIHEEMIASYTELHRMGYAHSVEVWMPKIAAVSQLQVEGETRRQRANDADSTGAALTRCAKHSVREGRPSNGSRERLAAPVTCRRCTARSERGSQHSIAEELELAGGLYGMAIGCMFFGESMFSRRADASKIALAHLSAQLARWNFGMIDCQMNTAHLASLGAREIPRKEFVARLRELVNYANREPPWELEHDLIA